MSEFLPLSAAAVKRASERGAMVPMPNAQPESITTALQLSAVLVKRTPLRFEHH